MSPRCDSCRLPLAKMHCLLPSENVWEKKERRAWGAKNFWYKGHHPVSPAQLSSHCWLPLTWQRFSLLFSHPAAVRKMSPWRRSVFLSIWKDFAINNSNEVAAAKSSLPLKGFHFSGNSICVPAASASHFVFANSFWISRSLIFPLI